MDQGKRSIINTAYSNDFTDYGDMRKSKIQNLPNFKKINLGQNLPFVVVFQAIEIERLSTEVESNRIKIKDFERQIFNAQNYEVQIRQLTEKCFSLEMQRGNLLEQIQKLNLISKQLYNELDDMKRKYAQVDLTLRDKFQMQRTRNNELMQQIQKWKNRYTAAEKSKDKQLQDLRHMMDNQRKSMIDREIRQLTLKFQTDRGNLENQIRKLREGIQYKNRQLDEFRQRCQKYEISMMQLRKSQSTIADLNSKINMMNQQISRLNDSLRQKQDQIDGIRQKEYKLQQKIKQQEQWEFENKKLRGNLENRTRQIEDWRIKCGNLQDDVAKGRQNTQNKRRDFEGNLNNLNQQKDRINIQLRQKTFDYDDLKNKYNRLQQEINHLKEVQNEHRQAKNKIRLLASQQERLQKIIRQTNEILQEQRSLSNNLGCKVILLSAQIERNAGGTGIKSKEFMQMKQNFYKLEKSCRDKDNQIMILSQKAASIQNQLKHIIGQLQKYLHLVTAHQRKAQELQQQIIQYQDYAKRIMILSAQIDRITGENKGLEQDIRKLRLRYADNIAAQKKHQDMCLSFVMLFVQIQSLRSRLAQREVSIQQMRKSVLQPVRNIK